MSIKIFLADDHPLIMQGVQLILDNEPDLEVIGRATDGRTLVREAKKQQPDVVILDITMPELNGIEAARQLRQEIPHCRIIMLSMHGTARLVMQALEAGADGYLLKGSANEDVVDAVRNVIRGRRYLSEKITDAAGTDLPGRDRARPWDDPLSRLSAREREVMQLVVEGNTNAQIAEKLHLSPKSIATYRGRLMQKLNLPDLPSLVRFTLENNLTPGGTTDEGRQTRDDGRP